MNQEEHIHGGDWAGYEQEYGVMPLDFSSNISPLGIPQSVQKAIADSAVTADRYPDPMCRELCDCIGEKEEVPPEYILCGNGAADLIFRIAAALRPSHAIVTAPSFYEYRNALEMTGCQVTCHPLQEGDGFLLREDILDEITEETDVIFLCEPNNPTGRTTDRGLLIKILEKCRQCGTMMVVDECFMDFVDDPKQHSLKEWLADNPDLIILRAFTKIYAMAGVRLGYCMSANRSILEMIRLSGQPWPVSKLASDAGIAALEDTEYVKRVRKTVSAQRPLLKAGLEKMGLRVIPGEANYLLFQSHRPLTDALKDRGILIRSCSNFDGLDESWYRTAVRTQEDNQRLLTALREVLV